MIDAAERIVAEHGLAALTLRGVQQAAGQSNKSAANYHFGSRDGLIAAILDDRMAPIHVHRRALLDRLDRDHRSAADNHDGHAAARHLRALVEALVVPLARRVLTVPGSTYARFLAQSMVSPELAEMITQQSTMFTVSEVQRRMVDALTTPEAITTAATANHESAHHGPAGHDPAAAGAAVVVLDVETAQWRTDGLLGHVIGALAAAEPGGDPVDVGRITSRLVDTCHGMLTAPTGPAHIELTSADPTTDSAQEVDAMTTAPEKTDAGPDESPSDSPIPTSAFTRRSSTDPLLMFGPIIADRVPEGFDTRPYERIRVTPAGTTIGAEIDGVRLGGDVDEATLAELHRALLEWKVLFFRDQDISRDEHREFARLWGELEQHPFFRYTQPGQTDVDVATLEKGMSSAGVENSWHNDVTWSATPSFGAVLRAVDLPESGGDTLWADTAAAYDTLPDEIRERLDGLTAEHDWLHAFGRSMPTDAVGKLRPHLPAVQHPLVRVIPETGRKVLFACQVFTTRVLGVSQEESDELLSIIYRHVQRPEFQVRLRWRPNTMAFWDNRACQHYAASDYHPQRRVMDRISIVGGVPEGTRA